MTRFLAALSLAIPLAFSAPAMAQDTHALAREYTELPDVQVMFDDMFAPEMLAQQFRLGVPPEIEISDDQLARIGVVMGEMMSSLRPELTEMMVAGMGENFTVGELEALIGFYSSPEGAAVMRKMQPFMQQIMAQFMPLIQQRQQEYLPALIEILEK